MPPETRPRAPSASERASSPVNAWTVCMRSTNFCASCSLVFALISRA
ncbi:Uncharacterised protein [Mycobacteroides abscessus subsp. abscessus]|nr:Uncharacterised protein [Mycobacteroides abscessus subsp. abscessus]